ncbi:MAG: carboxypeptidase regulatory-like domain-containing protein, partial [Acidobacteriia bacterium]|nr:carboxypeptidase regulatory-like domain-containing protein [Terriglobia bacterium]
MKIKLLFVLLALGTTGWAQSGANSGQIVGQVLDPSAAAISGAAASILNKDTHFKRTATTDKAGRYAVSDLPLGPYLVSVNASGFETTAQDALVTLGSSVSVNFNLPLAGKTESLKVTGDDVPGIEPTASAPKSILTDLQIHELPSQGR